MMQQTLETEEVLLTPMEGGTEPEPDAAPKTTNLVILNGARVVTEVPCGYPISEVIEKEALAALPMRLYPCGVATGHLAAGHLAASGNLLSFIIRASFFDGTGAMHPLEY